MMYRLHMIYRFCITVFTGLFKHSALCKEVADTVATPKIFSKYFEAINRKTENFRSEEVPYPIYPALKTTTGL